MNILIDAHDISTVGGIERFVAELANSLVRQGHSPYLFTYARKNTRPQFRLEPSIRIVHYFYSGVPRHIKRIKQQILACAPDVFLSPHSHNTHLLWCAALEGTGVPLVYSEHNDPEIIERERWDKAERSAALCVADSIHLLFNKYAESVPQCVRKHVHIIPNPVTIAPLDACGGKTKNSEQILLSLGRLKETQKQLSLLIHAFALLAPEFPTWRLDIWGDGPDKNILQREIDRHGLRGSAFLCGLTNIPQKQYVSADVFCIPSRYEGMPLSAIEAQKFGLPVVAFAGCSALHELLDHGKTGLLAPEMTAESLAATLRPLMANTALRCEIGKNAQKSAEIFAQERIMDTWETLLIEAATHKGNTRLQECMHGKTLDPAFIPYYDQMRKMLCRKNILLKNSQIFRAIYQQFPFFRLLPASIIRLVQKIETSKEPRISL